ncbi:hypothetical protein BJ085DRAFT_37630 [Dimargaris cristalligena]|uniref:Zinc-finger domain-containing protein n=1 Tax=Dimargaris cristalligena TaxID=215637 RepID=A0A4V1J5T7_9FUNG|nr:hypothetical protein BJ085DRAFT_37630 [Dimargaris cristalligena]|eukprot:RKP40199.1 hypothetical protein BJ085DRAFT_37630 [Dimargaris cristalligena]
MLPIDDYEVSRQKQIKANQEMLAALGLGGPTLTFKTPASKTGTRALKRSFSDMVPRRSERRISSGQDTNYNPVASDDEDHYMEPSNPRKIRRMGSINSALQKNRNKSVFVRNGRVYDGINGESCHQCRQKTTDKKIRPHGSDSLGTRLRILLGSILVPLYGDGPSDPSTWVCPKCRLVCNCSFCRKLPNNIPTIPPRGSPFRKSFRRFSSIPDVPNMPLPICRTYSLRVKRSVPSYSDGDDPDDSLSESSGSMISTSTNTSSRYTPRAKLEYWAAQISKELPKHEVYVLVAAPAQNLCMEV